MSSGFQSRHKNKLEILWEGTAEIKVSFIVLSLNISHVLLLNVGITCVTLWRPPLRTIMNKCRQLAED